MNVNRQRSISFEIPCSTAAARTNDHYADKSSEPANSIDPNEFKTQLGGFFEYLDEVICTPLQSKALELHRKNVTFTVDDATECITEKALTDNTIIKKLKELLQVQLTDGTSKGKIIDELEARIKVRRKKTENTRAAETAYRNFREDIKSVLKGTGLPPTTTYSAFLKGIKLGVKEPASSNRGPQLLPFLKNKKTGE